MEYFFNQGNKYYLCNERFNEYAVFDSFGKMIDVFEGKAVALNRVKVNIVSVLSTGSGVAECEICLNGRKKVFNTTSTSALIALRKLGNYMGTIFTANYNMDENPSQAFLAFREGVVSEVIVDKILRSSFGFWEDL